MEFYKKISVVTKNEVFNPTHNKIDVRYVKDRNRGVHIFFKKVDKTDGQFESFMIMGDNTSFNLLLKPLARANKKTLAKVETVVESFGDKLFDLYESNKRTELKAVLDEIINQVA